MSVQSDIEILHLFNEEADKLESLSFKTKMLRDDTGVTITIEQGKEVVQDNEPTSLRNMSKLYATLPASCSTLIEDFNKAREAFNAGLNSATGYRSRDHSVTYQQVMDTFLWGGHAHATKKYKERYDRLRRNPVAFKLLEHFFTTVLAEGLRMILYVRELNKTAIRQLSGAIGTTP
jgi:hypothetical protein